MVLPLIMGGIGLAAQAGQMFRQSPDLAYERKKALDELHGEQKAVANQQFDAAQQGMLQTASMGGTAGGRASARAAAMNASPNLYNQAMTNAAGIGQQNLNAAAGLGGNLAGYQQGANASQDTGLASIGSKILGAASGGAAGSMLSDERAKTLEDENASLRAQLAQFKQASAEDQAFIQRQVDLQRINPEQARSDAPQFQIRDPQMSSDLAAYWLMNQPSSKGSEFTMGDRANQSAAARLGRGDMRGQAPRDWSVEPPIVPEGELSDDRAKVLEGKLAREKAKTKDLSGQLSAVRGRAGMSSDEAAAWIQGLSKTPKSPAGKSPRLSPEQNSPDFQPHEPVEAALDPGWKMFPQGYAQYTSPPVEDKIVASPYERQPPIPDGETIVAPPWEKRADNGPTEQFRLDQRKLMRGGYAGGQPMSEQEINDAIMQRWREENPRSDERTKNVGRFPVRTKNGWEMRSEGDLPEGYGSKFEPAKAQDGGGQYGSGGNFGRIWTSSRGDWTGSGDWSNPGEGAAAPPVRLAELPGTTVSPKSAQASQRAFSNRPDGSPGAQFEESLQERIARLAKELDDMVAAGRGVPRAAGQTAQARPMFDQDMARMQSIPGPVAMGSSRSPAFHPSNGYQSDQGKRLSDIRTKTEGQVAPAIDMVKKTPGAFYHYKPGFGENTGERHYGPMAQDLEKSAVGRTVVNTGPDGYKRVDTPRLTLANTAALHEIATRLEKLEGGKRGRSST